MVERLNKTDILIERMISLGKTKAYLRVPMFIAIIFVIFFVGIAEKTALLMKILFPTPKSVTRCLAFVTALIIATPLMQPVGVFAEEVIDALPETTETGSTSPEETEPAPESQESTEVSSETDNTTVAETSVSTESGATETTAPDTSSTDDTSVTDVSDTTVTDETAESSESSDSEEILPELLPSLFSMGPQEISTPEDLYNFITDENNLSTDINLTADIDMSSNPIPLSSVVNGEYTGTILGTETYSITGITYGVETKDELKSIINDTIEVPTEPFTGETPTSFVLMNDIDMEGYALTTDKLGTTPTYTVDKGTYNITNLFVEIDTADKLRQFLSYGYYPVKENVTDTSINNAILESEDKDAFSGIGNYAPVAFSGILDGNGHTISGINITRKSKQLGLFSSLSNATIKNLGLKDCSFNTNSEAGSYAGSFAGVASNSEIQNCFAVNITLNAYNYIGCFTGNGGGALTNCVYASISPTFSGKNKGYYQSNYSSADIETFNQTAELYGWKKWYADSNPINQNGGCPSFEPTYKVVFKDNNGNSDLTGIVYTSGTTTATEDTYYIVDGQGLAELTTKPTKPKSEFVGWSLTPNSSSKIADDWTFNSDTDQSKGEVTLYAIWVTTNTYRLNYYKYDAVNGEYVLDSDSGEINVTEFAADPSIEQADLMGYDKKGWYLGTENADSSITFGNAWNFATSTVSKQGFFDEFGGVDTVTLELNLYQRYDPKTYTVTTKLNGGSVSKNIPTTYTVKDSVITLPTENEITRKGYTFDGWTIESITAESPSAPAALSPITEIDPSWCATITIKANWTPITYKVAYDGNNATAGSMTETDHTYDVAANLSANQYEKTYYDFKGWSYNGNTYADNASVINLTDVAGDTVTLTAIWEAHNYNITYVDMAGVGSMTNTQNPATFNVENDTITLAEPTKAGYTFVGWYSEQEFTNKVETIDPAQKAGSDITLYAKWTLNTYSVTFDTNGGAFTPDTPTIEYNIEEGVTQAIPTNVTKDYYTFSKWTVTSKDGNIPLGDITEIPANSYGNITVQAQWTAVEYTLTYDTNGGDLPAGARTTYTYDDVATLPTPTKTGYSFTGWRITASDSDTSIIGNLITGLNNNHGNLTLKAEWSVNTYTISFESNGGTTVSRIKQDYQSNVYPPAAPTKTGYDFAGWYKNSDLSGDEYEFTTMPAEDFTLYAKWEIQTFDVTFNDIDATPNSPQNVEYGSTPTYFVPTKAEQGDVKFRFLGWYADSLFSEIYDFDAPIYEDTTVYAKWYEYTDATGVFYDVTFRTSDDDAGNVVAYAEGEHLVFPALPAADVVNQREPIGWKITDAETGEAISEELYQEGEIFVVGAYNIIVTAQWDVATYDVEFISEGETITTQSVEYNSTIAEFTPVRNGFIFKGWVYTNDTSVSFDASTPIVEDISLTAVWEEIVINVPSGSSSSSEKVIRMVENTAGIPFPSKISVSANMQKFTSSVDVRMTKTTPEAESEFNALFSNVTESIDKIFIFDISLYERGTTRKITSLKQGTVITYRMPVPEIFDTDADKIKVLSVHEGKLELHDSEVYTRDGYLMISFTSTHCSTYAFVLDIEDIITIGELSAAAGTSMASVLLVSDARIFTNESPVFSSKRGSIFSRKKRRYHIKKR
ncbi:MAG: hypothetical protein E7507_08140 [Ruminococcus sp.]|nr:hypothetical protein [Ruminococcus sp.]